VNPGNLAIDTSAGPETKSVKATHRPLGDECTLSAPCVSASTRAFRSPSTGSAKTSRAMLRKITDLPSED
jgi:hypothetical protein